MTIDEAIRHCGEVAEEQEELYRICPASESETSHCNGTKDCRVLKNGKNKGCQKCAEEHRQLAGWLKELKQLRKQSKTGRWIPCSERLPEESGYYLVTYHNWSDGNFLPKYDDTYVRRLHYQISEHFVGWNYPKNVDDRAENDCHKEVIAWQPLPEPYKERD